VWACGLNAHSTKVMMATNLTEKEFSRHVNTKFLVQAPQSVELELVEVKGYKHKDAPGEQGGMERFSVFFRGPEEVLLTQATYDVAHEQMGEFHIFIVPVGRHETGFRYEAVFNY